MEALTGGAAMMRGRRMKLWRGVSPAFKMPRREQTYTTPPTATGLTLT